MGPSFACIPAIRSSHSRAAARSSLARSWRMIGGNGRHDIGSAGDAPSGAADAGGRTTSRRGLLGSGTFLAGSALAAGGVVIALAERADSSSSERDVRILNYVLRLEQLRAAFYREAS
jgi:hypothetical protein